MYILTPTIDATAPIIHAISNTMGISSDIISDLKIKDKKLYCQYN